MRRWRERFWRTWPRLLGLVLPMGIAMAGASDPHGLPAQPSAGPVLLLSQLPASLDGTVMETLERELRAGNSQARPDIVRVEISADDADAAQLQPLVNQALQRRPWRLVVATNRMMAQLVLRSGLRIPMLFRSSDHPVTTCLVHSLRHPGTLATGYTSSTRSEGKMAEALHLAYPGLEQIVMLIDGRPEAGAEDCPPPAPQPPCSPGFVDDVPERDALLLGMTNLAEVLRATRSAHFQLRVLRLCEPEDVNLLPRWLPANKGSMPRTGLVVFYHDLLYEEGKALVAQARRLRLPAIFGARHFLPMGALMTMAPVAEPPGEARGIELAGRILAGESPADIPVQRPEGVELIVNINVARRMGLPPSKAALRAADRLIR